MPGNKIIEYKEPQIEYVQEPVIEYEYVRRPRKIKIPLFVQSESEPIDIDKKVNYAEYSAKPGWSKKQAVIDRINGQLSCLEEALS